jgi:hypothetical protein
MDHWTLRGDRLRAYSESMKRVASRNSIPRIKWLSRIEGFALLDREARAALGVSGKTFVKRWNAGRYAKRVCRPEVMRVAMLLPFAR